MGQELIQTLWIQYTYYIIFFLFLNIVFSRYMEIPVFFFKHEGE